MGSLLTAVTGQYFSPFLRRPGRGAVQYPRSRSFGRFASYGGAFVNPGKLELTNRQLRTKPAWPENSLNLQKPIRVKTTPRTTTVRTTTTTTLSTTSRISFTKESLLRTEANPFLSIDMDRFSVIPAVPGSSVAATEARPRAAKTTEVSSDDNIPSGFSPVPAVPAVP